MKKYHLVLIVPDRVGLRAGESEYLVHLARFAGTIRRTGRFFAVFRHHHQYDRLNR